MPETIYFCQPQDSFKLLVNVCLIDAFFDGASEFCDSSTTVYFYCEGVGPWTVEYSLNGIDNAVFVETNPYSIELEETALLVLASVENESCFNLVSDSLYVMKNKSAYAGISNTFTPELNMTGTVNLTDFLLDSPDLNGSWYDPIGQLLPSSEINLMNLIAGEYRYTVIDTVCNTRDSAYLNIILSDYYIPNIFSPNQDGINDHFRMYSDNYIEASIAIFDRWGNMLFEDPEFLNKGWNGSSIRGSILSGVYFYKILAKRKSGSETLLSGDITLLR